MPRLMVFSSSRKNVPLTASVEIWHSDNFHEYLREYNSCFENFWVQKWSKIFDAALDNAKVIRICWNLCSDSFYQYEGICNLFFESFIFLGLFGPFWVQKMAQNLQYSLRQPKNDQILLKFGILITFMNIWGNVIQFLKILYFWVCFNLFGLACNFRWRPKTAKNDQMYWNWAL